jgi:Gly-Xaa carboxypeptidase
MPPIPLVDYYTAGADEKGQQGQDREGSLTPLTAPSARRPRSRVRSTLRWTVVLAVVAQGLLIVYPSALGAVFNTVSNGRAAIADAFIRTKTNRVCPQEEALVPQRDINAKLWETLGKDISTEEFKERAVKWHSGAVQIPTESYDKMAPVGEDPRWEPFAPFHEYLLKVFPNVQVPLLLQSYPEIRC